jgi:hypothetical protein
VQFLKQVKNHQTTATASLPCFHGLGERAPRTGLLGHRRMNLS